MDLPSRARYHLPQKDAVREILRQDVDELPGFPPAVAKLIGILSDPKASPDDLSRIIATDPGISSKVLSLANAALYSPRQKITSVSDAVLYVGFDELKKLSLEVLAFEKLVSSPEKRQFDRLFFWRHCLCVAIMSMKIAEMVNYPRPGEAYAAGLLHDIGKIILDLQGSVDYDEFITDQAASTGRLIVEEKDVMGMGHDELGAYYGRRTNLPDAIILAVRYHHESFDHLSLSAEEALLISSVSLADFLSWTQGIGSINLICQPVLQPEIERFIDLDRIDIIEIISSMDKEMKLTSSFYDFIFPSSNQLRENLLRANLRLSRMNTLYHYQEASGSAFVDVAGISESITAPHRSLDPRAIITGTLEAIHRDFQFRRIYVMKVKRLRKILKVVAYFDALKNGVNLGGLEISITDSEGGFVRCLRNKEAINISGGTPDENGALEAFKTNAMIIVPVCSHSKVIGILGMDTPDENGKNRPAVFSALTMVAHELGIALENAGIYREAKAGARTDGLTGLLNRATVDALLADAFRKALAGQNQLSLVMIDVDHFKKFNDRYGHITGDTILKLISAVLKKFSRPFDYVGRYGGEEFIVILNNTELSKATCYAERIRSGIERLGKLLEGRFPGLPLTVSAGVAEYSSEMKRPDSLISAVDRALYRAKETGRNRVVTG